MCRPRLHSRGCGSLPLAYWWDEQASVRATGAVSTTNGEHGEGDGDGDKDTTSSASTTMKYSITTISIATSTAISTATTATESPHHC
jgi:hypothetical protein